MAVQHYEGIGRRKEYTARVRLSNGNGQIIVNQKPGEAYFTRYGDLDIILAPLSAVGTDRSAVDISVVVDGGAHDAIQSRVRRVSFHARPKCGWRR